MSRDFPVSPFGPKIAIDPDGVWLVDGDPVVHPTVLAELVGRLARRPDGTHVIRAGGGEVAIDVAEAPFVVRTLEVERGADGRIARLDARLSDGTEEVIDPGSLRRLAAPAAGPDGARFACSVKGGRFEARLSRFATYRLLAEAEPTDDGRARLETTRGTVVL